MPYINRREGEGGTADDQTWSYVVRSFTVAPAPRWSTQPFPTGSFATAQRAEKRHAIKTKAVKEVLAGAPASA
jgi:hypothetical protein